jgi:hypothetical protein
LYALTRSRRLATRSFLALSSLLHFFFVMSFQYLYPSKLTHLVATIRHPDTTGHFRAARLFFPNVSSMFTTQYTEFMQSLPVTHSHTHLPGPVLCYRLSIDFFKSNPTISGLYSRLIAALGFNPQDLGTLYGGPAYLTNAAFNMAVFYSILLCLAMIPVYFLARELFDRKVADISVLLWIFVPATVVFFPQMDLTYPVFSAASLLFLVRHLKHGRALDMALCSIAISVGIFLSFAFVTSVVLCGITYSAFGVQSGRLAARNFRSHARSLLWFVLPATVFYGALYLFGNINVFDAFSVAMGINERVQSEFPSLGWPLFFTWYDYFTFASVIASLFFLRLAYTTASSLISGRVQPHAYALVSYLLLLVALVFSGVVTAEVARIWIFLMPFLVVFAAKSIDEAVGSSLPLVLSIFACSLFQVIVFKMTFAVMFDQRQGFGG